MSLLDLDDPTTIKWYAGATVRDPQMTARLSGMVSVDHNPAVAMTATEAAIRGAEQSLKAAASARASNWNPFEPELPKRTVMGSDLSRLDADPGMQVWCEKELIGWLKVSPALTRQNAIEIPIVEELPFDEAVFDMNTPIAHRVLRLAIVKRHAAISDFEMMRHANLDDLMRAYRKRYRISNDATVYREPNSDRLVFRWRVIEVSLEQSEELFDMDSFIPNPDAR